MKIKITDEEFVTLFHQSRSQAAILHGLGLVPAGGNYDTLKARAARLGLDLSALPGKGWLKGGTHNSPRGIPLAVLLDCGVRTHSDSLRKKLIKEGLKLARCESCTLVEWNGEPIPLELDHINGDRLDNRLVNLRVLCPNCHAQTPTYRRKKRARGEIGVRAGLKILAVNRS